MKLYAQHFLFLCVNQIDTFILIASWATSRYSPKTCVRIVLSYFFIFPKEFDSVLDSLLGSGEFPDFQSEMFTDSLATETDAEQWGVATSLNNLSYFFHFFIGLIIDIAWTTSEDQDIFLRFITWFHSWWCKSRLSFCIVDHTDVTSQRSRETGKCE